MVHYKTVTEAIEQLKKLGFVMDFNVEDNRISYHLDKYHPNDFEIVEIYRYEGSSDPGDEAVVYGIESKDGKKGVLVSGYGPSEDPMLADIIGAMKVRTAG